MKPLPDISASIQRIQRPDGPSAELSGVRRCSSPWACPVCGPRIGAKRAAILLPQIEDLELLQDYRSWLITLTLRHHRGDELDDLFAKLSKAWSRLTSGKAWARTKAGGVEYVRGYDLTRGREGWHPHIHVAMLFGPGIEDDEAEAKALLARWQRILRSLGAEALPQGLDAQRARDPEATARYAMTISGVSEATSAAGKRGKAVGGKTAHQLLEAAVSGDSTAERHWIEYARITKGRRAVAVSQGLSLTEDEAAEDEGTDKHPREIVATLSGAALRRIDPQLGAILEASRESVGDGRRLLEAILGPPKDALWRVPKSP